MAQTKPKAGQFYGVSGNGTDGQFLQTDGAGGMAWATPVTNPALTSIDYPGSATAADPAGGESIIINGTGFQTGITCTVGGTSATTAFNSATQITITSPAKAAGQYTVAVTNTDGGSGSSANFIQYSGVPVWSTASGSLGSVQEGASASFQVTATEGSDTIEYAVTSGSLPSGLSLNTNTGAITGTAPSVAADTTSTFSITATDDENQTSSARSFSITVTNIAPSSLFNTALYTGNATNNSVNIGFDADLTWIKNRGATGYHILFDTLRGLNEVLHSDSNLPQQASGMASSYSSGTLSFSGSTTWGNKSANTYVAWGFKGGGTPTATNSAGQTPTAGSKMVNGVADSTAFATVNNGYPSKQSVNTNLEFSITEYTKTASGASQIPHGLSGTPDLILLKFISPGYNDVWQCWSSAMNTGSYLELNSTATANTRANSFSAVNSTYIENDWTSSSLAQIVYSFKSKAGYSKIGSFTGNGTSSKLIETGFEVGWVMLKNIDTAYRWYMLDNKRGGSSRLFADDASAASTNQETVKFLANGFEITTSDAEVNKSGDTIIYMAFAADGSTTTPSLASSFSATENTSPSTNQAIAAGFTPDMAWIKGSTIGSGNPTAWGQYDTIRGDGMTLQSDNNGAEGNYNTHPSGDLAMKFTSTGYNTPPLVNNNINNTSDDYINYFWKAGGLSSINTTGTITSIVSANAAAGISVVKYIGNNTSGATIAHGLSSAPEMMIVKRLDSSGDWLVYNSNLGATKYLIMNVDDAAYTASNVWNDTAPTSSVFSIGNYAEINTSGGSYIAYLFTSITGFSKAGSYVGNNPTAVSVSLGFNPDMVVIKNTTSSADWVVYDKQRSPTGNFDDYLYLNTTGAQGTTGGNWVTPTATGFTTNSAGGSLVNENGSTFIYLAFKQN